MKKVFACMAVLVIVFVASSMKVEAAEVPNLLKRMLDEISQAFNDSNCNPETFQQKFNDLERRYRNYEREDIPNVSGKYQEARDSIQSHEWAGNECLPQSFEYLFHLNRYLVLKGGLYEANLHILFYIKNTNGSLSLCIVFYDRYRNICKKNCFDLSDCNSMDNAYSWTEETARNTVPVPFDFYMLDQETLNLAFSRAIELGVSTSVACHFVKLLAEDGPSFLAKRNPEVVLLEFFFSIMPKEEFCKLFPFSSRCGSPL